MFWASPQRSWRDRRKVQEEGPLWAIVPVKGLSSAKSRLSPVLSPSQRAMLVVAMLWRTLQVLARVDVLSRILVVSDDPRIQAIVADIEGVHYLRETGTGGLNAALSQAARYAGAAGARALLVIPGDLPRLTPSAVRLMLQQVTPPVVAIAPDRREQGTNALLVAPPDVIPFAFGRHSFRKHCEEAHIRGVEPRIIRDERLATDLDLPEDLTFADGLISSGDTQRS